MHRLTVLARIFLVAVLVGCADAQESEPASTRSLVDDLDRTVAVPQGVDRVVTLAPNLTELTIAAGGRGRLVGVSTPDEHPALADSIARVGALPVDYESIAALEPDLILATDQVNDPKSTETFSNLEIPIYFFSFETVYDVPRAIGRLGRILRTDSAASSTSDSLEVALRRFDRRSAERGDRPRVLFLISDEPLYAFGRGSYVHQMIELAGGRSVTDTLSSSSPVLSDEFVLKARPDIVIGTLGENYNTQDLLEAHPTWRHLPVVREERVYTVPEDWVLRPGPQIVRGIEHMARRISGSSTASTVGVDPTTRTDSISLTDHSSPASPR